MDALVFIVAFTCKWQTASRASCNGGSLCDTTPRLRVRSACFFQCDRSPFLLWIFGRTDRHRTGTTSGDGGYHLHMFAGHSFRLSPRLSASRRSLIQNGTGITCVRAPPHFEPTSLSYICLTRWDKMLNLNPFQPPCGHAHGCLRRTRLV